LRCIVQSRQSVVASDPVGQEIVVSLERGGRGARIGAITTVDGERTVVGAGIAERMQIESCRILPSGWPLPKASYPAGRADKRHRVCVPTRP
jgi:hypothetical protein